MRLESLSYAEFEGQNQEWRLDGITLGPTNLLVGKNAAGKTRIINVIANLARHLAGLHGPTISGHYEVNFDNLGKKLSYRLRCAESKVLEERFTVDGNVLLDRSKANGEGTILAEQIENGIHIKFQTPPTELAVVARRDAIQHSFLEPLYEWGSQMRQFYFGSNMRKDRFAMFVPKGGAVFDDRDPNAVVALFKKADKELGSSFLESVISNMASLGYSLNSINVGEPVSIRVIGDMPVDLQCLRVNEQDLPGVTDQQSMSQGMFRALSIIIQINYFHVKGLVNCILIDDIGEGLDFDRSCRLIEMLRAKAQEWSVQLIMSTNDRFVMNKVPLEEWSLIQRQGAKVTVRNYDNSRAAFEEFKFTGLNNFDFFATDFLTDQSVEQPVGT
jgi:energy-coupling factor transporter ATP-binding protein EcfA2